MEVGLGMSASKVAETNGYHREFDGLVAPALPLVKLPHHLAHWVAGGA